MKRRINTLLALLFIISTLTTSLHELLPHHNSSDCQVCTTAEHSSALLPETTALKAVSAADYAPVLSLANQYLHRYKTTLGSQAPPLFS
ncbi:MAG: hypothetical protein PF439_12230 [Helicobacteraceae bacterium]|jgi:hypothetical protein|nr:hypothetical protein [Helicobacteraceae bacterium]